MCSIELGHSFVELDFPEPQVEFALTMLLLRRMLIKSLKIDGVKFGHRAEAENINDLYLKTRSEGFGDEAKKDYDRSLCFICRFL